MRSASIFSRRTDCRRRSDYLMHKDAQFISRFNRAGYQRRIAHRWLLEHTPNKSHPFLPAESIFIKRVATVSNTSPS